MATQAREAAARRRVFSRPRAIAFALAMACLFVTSASGAQSGIDQSKAARVKAAYLRYIAQFTTWPEGTFDDASSAIVVGVIGDDPHGVARLLETAIEQRALTVQGRPLELRRIALPEDVDDAAFEGGDVGRALESCHVLFLLRSVGRHWPRVRERIGTRAVITVSEVEGFARRAGMIEFVTDPGVSRVNMHIDLDAVHEAKLRLSSKLLGLKQGVTIVSSNGPVSECTAGRCKRPASKALELTRYEGEVAGGRDVR